MKNLFFAIIILVLISGVTSKFIFGCTNPQSEDLNITDIDKKKQDILNQLNTFTKKEKYYDSLHYWYSFYKDKDLQMITQFDKNQNYSPDKFDVSYYMYYHERHLFYIEEILWDLERNDTTFVYKFYISNGHLLAKFDNGRKIDSTSIDFRLSQEFVDSAMANLKTFDMEK
jgi:hypothetical protein